MQTEETRSTEPSDVTGEGGTDEAIPTANDPLHHQPSFTGSGGEYFRIWIVNTLLSLVTLGIYSAWATVRNRRYLYGNVDLDGHRFDFHGSPIAILKGRLIAVALFAVYAFGGNFHWGFPLAAAAVFGLGFPWVLVKSMRFRLANTSYRGLRFGFGATTGQAYRALFIVLVMGLGILGIYVVLFFMGLGADEEEIASGAVQLGRLMLSLLVVMALSALVMVVFNYRLRELVMNHVRFGRHGFSARLSVGVFWKAMGLAVAALLLAIVAMIPGILVAGFMGLLKINMFVWLAVMYAMIIPAYLLPFAVWHCKVSNHVISATRLESVALRQDLKIWAWWWIFVSNAFAAVLTLGLAIPWARVRMMRYTLSRLQVHGDLDQFAADTRQDPTAIGDEIVEVFDFELGF